MLKVHILNDLANNNRLIESDRWEIRAQMHL